MFNSGNYRRLFSQAFRSNSNGDKPCDAEESHDVDERKPTFVNFAADSGNMKGIDSAFQSNNRLAMSWYGPLSSPMSKGKWSRTQEGFKVPDTI